MKPDPFAPLDWDLPDSLSPADRRLFAVKHNAGTPIAKRRAAYLARFNKRPARRAASGTTAQSARELGWEPTCEPLGGPSRTRRSCSMKGEALTPNARRLIAALAESNRPVTLRHAGHRAALTQFATRKAAMELVQRGWVRLSKVRRSTTRTRRGGIVELSLSSSSAAA